MLDAINEKLFLQQFLRKVHAQGQHKQNYHLNRSISNRLRTQEKQRFIPTMKFSAAALFLLAGYATAGRPELSVRICFSVDPFPIQSIHEYVRGDC